MSEGSGALDVAARCRKTGRWAGDVRDACSNWGSKPRRTSLKIPDSTRFRAISTFSVHWPISDSPRDR